MRVLLCHRLNLGDLVCASPAIQWAKARSPGLEFRLFTNDFAARVGRLIPAVEHVYEYRKFGQAATPEWRMLLSARAWKPQQVIGLAFDADARLALRVFLAGGRPRRAQFRHTHVAERLAELFGWQAAEPLPAASLRLPPGASDKRDLAIYTAARKPSNRPSARQIAELVRALLERRPGLRIALFGLPGRTDSGAHQPDAEAQRALAQLGLQLETPPFEALLRELASSRAVITPDGGISHIAAAFGKPVVSLFGNVPQDVWRPYSPRAKVLQAGSRRVADIAPREIVEAWESLEAIH